MHKTVTNWTRYYEAPFFTAHITRRITGRILVNMLVTGGFPAGGSIIELGGGNSAFCDTFMNHLDANHFTAIDNNPRGVELFRAKHSRPETEAIRADLFTLDANSIEPADLVFSIGVVEHFSDDKMKTAFQRHFEFAKPGGLVLITFPTPVFPYCLIRGMAEVLGLWRFPDERPIPLEKAANLCAEFGDLLAKRLNRAIMLTQGILLSRVPPKKVHTRKNER